ncbi:hypothetical protein E2562_032479 [Oryza meyeriana var. granulata]|uniref:Uncharacterized protein n=1 Tax=Oryza meyeriana var. granulata TaxID=110450 RepID=A0A6G1ERW1_9ORYZ|nr:hypothetical protein E2562_032479 [Oryza meyeriana var. granulata]
MAQNWKPKEAYSSSPKTKTSHQQPSYLARLLALHLHSRRNQTPPLLGEGRPKDCAVAGGSTEEGAAALEGPAGVEAPRSSETGARRRRE